MDLHFDPRQQISNAVSWTKGKRHHRQWVQFLGMSRIETIWIELIRRLPVSGVPLNKIGWDVNLRSGRNEKITKLIVFQRPARKEPESWIQAQRLFEDLARVGKSRQIMKGRDIANREGSDLLGNFVFNLRVLREQIPRPI